MKKNASKQNTYYIDTSFFIAVFDETDAHHNRAMDFIKAFKTKYAKGKRPIFYVGWPTLWETTNALIKNHGKAVARLFLTKIFEYEVKSEHRNLIVVWEPLQLISFKAKFYKKTDMQLGVKDVLDFFSNSDSDFTMAAGVSLNEPSFMRAPEKIQRVYSQTIGDIPNTSDGFDLFDSWVATFMLILNIPNILTFDLAFASELGFIIPKELYPPEITKRFGKRGKWGNITVESVNKGLEAMAEGLMFK